MSKEQPTLGETRVRSSFNPANDNKVDEIKTKVAELIDMMEVWKEVDPRLAAMTQSYLETACMYAVKLVTTPPVEQKQ